MELSRREMLLAALGGATVLVGCGGGTDGTLVEPEVAILWRSASTTRLEASSAARSARITLSTRIGNTASFLATRPDPVPETAVPYRFTEKIPDGTGSLEVTFYTSTDGTGPAIATAAGSVVVGASGETTLATVEISDRVQGLLLREVPKTLKVGESFTPVLEAVASGPDLPVALSALPTASVRWDSGGTLRQEESGSFVAIKAGQVKLTATVVRADGTEKTIDSFIRVESADQRQKLSMLVPLAQPLYQGKIVGVSRFTGTISLVDPTTEARIAYPLPSPGMNVLTSPDGDDMVWMLSNDNRVLWRMDLTSGSTAAILNFPGSYADLDSPDRSLLVYPLGGNRFLVLNTPAEHQHQLRLYDGDVRIGEPVILPGNSEISAVPLSDGSFWLYSPVEKKVTRYAAGPQGITQLSESSWTPPPGPYSSVPFQYSHGKVLALDGTIRNAQTLEIEHQVTVPPGIGGSMCLSPSGDKVLVSMWNATLRLLVYEVSTGRTLTDLQYEYSTEWLSEAKPFFVDDNTIAYFAQDNVYVLRGVVSS